MFNIYFILGIIWIIFLSVVSCFMAREGWTEGRILRPVRVAIILSAIPFVLGLLAGIQAAK